jgi:hypothetical protein
MQQFYRNVGLLRGEDSNPYRRHQKPMSYH